MKNRIFNQKGSSMLLVVCLFLILTVFGVNLLNAVNSNVFQTKSEFQKEQTMLYVNSIYDVVNQKIEEGAFLKDDNTLPQEVTALLGQGFTDSNGNDIGVRIQFSANTLPIQADVTITIKDEAGRDEEYLIRSTYSRVAGEKKLVRESCKGLVE